MSLFQYFWDDRAGLLLIGVPLDYVDLIDLVKVDWWRDDGSLMPIGLCVPGDPGEGGQHILAVRLPDEVAGTAFSLSVTGLCDHLDRLRGAGLSFADLQDRLRLDPSAPSERAVVTNWMVILDDDDIPRVELRSSSEKAPIQTVSKVWSSCKHGEVLNPASAGSGSGRGGSFRVQAIVPVDAEQGELDIVVTPEPGTTPPPTRFEFSTLSAARHAAPWLESGQADMAVAHNQQTHISEWGLEDGDIAFRIPADDAQPEDEDGEIKTENALLGYLDRIVVNTSPPAQFRLQVNATTNVALGKNGTVLLASGLNGYSQPDDGRLLDLVIEEFPDGATSVNNDLVNAFSDKGRSLQPTDLEQVSDVTAAIYAENTHQIQNRHPSGTMLSPRSLDDYLKAPSFFGMIGAIQSDMLPIGAVGRLMPYLNAGGETKGIAELGKLVLVTEHNKSERATKWMDEMTGVDAVFVSAIYPFFKPVRDVLNAGVNPVGVDVAQLLYLSDEGDTLHRLKRRLDLMTDVGILPNEIDAQFVPFENVEERIEDLDHLIEDTLDVMEQAYRAVSVSRAASARQRSDLETFSREIKALPKPKGTKKRRALAYIEEQLNKADLSLELGKMPLDLASFLGQLARNMYEPFREQFGRIERIVERTGIEDPIKLDSDNNVVQLSEVSEAQSSFVGAPLSADELSWLSLPDDDSPLVSSWKTKLRDQINPQKNRLP